MRKYFLGVLSIALCLGAAAMIRGSNRQDGSVGEYGAAAAIDGAFRDGIYQGELAVRRGSASHVAIGRWTATQDRASFAAGYRKGYTELLTAKTDTAHAVNGAFRDGLFLGTLAAKRGSEYHVATGRWASEVDRASFTAGYRRGYAEILAVRSSVGNSFRQSE